jgi:arylsulfatase A-like enzyme
MKRIVLQLCIISLLFVLLGGYISFRYASQVKPSKKDFNIVLITIDALRADHLSCYGYKRKTSPNIDKIAEKGILFKNAMSPSSWTVPSIVSLFTSVYPLNHGIVGGFVKDKAVYNQKVFSDNLITLAEILKANGYNTFGVASNLHLGENLGFARGFDYFKCLAFFPAPFVNEIIDSWEDKIKESEKFFLWIHYFDPHLPYKPRDPWIEKYTSKTLTQKLNLSKKKRFELMQLIPMFKKDSQALSNLIALYDSEINYVDSFIGKLIKKFGLDKNSLIIIAADHGEEFLEHGQVEHGNNLYQETTHIPLIIKLPYSTKKEISEEYVTLLDIMPTTLDLLNIKVTDRIIGKSLFADKRSGYFFSELSKFLFLKTIQTPEWKYIYNYTAKTEELYNIKLDPLEYNNLTDKNTKQRTKLKEQLFKWVSTGRKYPTQKKTIQLSPQEKEKLQGLGYIQ